MIEKYKKEIFNRASKENMPIKESLGKILWAEYYCASPPLFRLLNNMKVPLGIIISDFKKLEMLADLIIEENDL